MKKSIKQLVLSSIIAFLFISGTPCFAQFLPANTITDWWGETDPTYTIQSIGIGEFFMYGDHPKAALDIKIPYLQPAPLTSWSPGEAIHSTVAPDYDHAWRMYEYPEIEKFHIVNYNNIHGDKSSVELNVKEKGDLNFYTNNVHYMQLSRDGKLGISDAWSRLSWAMSPLHIHRDGNSDAFSQFTNKNTGESSDVLGFKVGIRYDSPRNKSFAELRQYSDAPMVFYTSNASNIFERMRITYGTGGPGALANMTKVSISYGNTFNPISDPLAMLNLGEGININSLGNRNWMEVGTHMVRQSDQMYVGIKDEGSDRGTAVINWGDNPTNGIYGPDMLKFIFTTMVGAAGDGGAADGLEISRMTAYGTMGIGTGWNNSNIIPKRRLDIIDNAASGGTGSANPAHTSGPQLRLTHTADASVTGGIYSDFETTSLGNLIFTPYSSTTSGKVGIGGSSSVNATYPLTTLHVANSGAAGTGAITSDYLNHTNSMTLPSSNPVLVYSDVNGTLKNLPAAANPNSFLRGDGQWVGTGPGNVSSCTGVLTNYIPVFDASSNICKSDLYDYNYQVGLNNTSPSATFHVTPHGSDAPLIISNSSSDKVLFVNSDDHVSIGSNTTLGTGGGTPCRLWVKGLTSGSSSSADNLVLTDALGHNFFKASDDGKIMIGGYYPNNNNTGPEARVSINTGNVSDYVNLVVRTSYSTVGTNDERALGVLNGSGSHLLTCWADEHVTMGYSGAQTSNDARLIVNTLNNGESAYFSGHIFYGSASAISDSTFKINAQPIRDSRSILNSLNPKSYNFDIPNNPGMNLPSGIHYGMYAQEIERVLPDLVIQENSPAVYDTSGNLTIPSRSFKSVNYTELIPFLTQALKEQQVTIDSINTVLANLQQRLDICCPAPSNRIIQGENNTIDISLSSVQAIVLNQNDPNPFSEKTQISFVIPDEVKTAEIIFYTSSGTVLKNIVVSSRGEGQMNVYASDLSSGVYYYSLVADGKTIATKKMVCNK